MNTEVIGFMIVGSVVAATFLFSHPPSSVNGLDPVKQNEPHFHLLRHEKDGDGTLEIKSNLDGRLGTLVLDRGKLFEPSAVKLEPPTSLSGVELDTWKKTHESWYTTSFTPDYYLVESTFDLGCFGAYRPSGRGHDQSFEVGFRYSPVRLLYGTVAADALLTRDAAGLGISIYPPEAYVGAKWHHVGIQLGWVASFAGDSPDGWLAGLSFTTIP